MSKSNSLSAVKNDAPSNTDLPVDGPTPEPQVKLGRKPKPKAEKADKPITLKFTQAEFDMIAEKAGLVSKATLLKQLLLDNTDLLRK